MPAATCSSASGSPPRPRRSCRSASSGTSLPRRPVVLDERLRLLVVDLEPPRDRLGRVVGAAFELGALEQPLDAHLVGHVEERGSRRVAADLARASRPAPRPARGCAGSRRARSRRAASACAEPLADQRDRQLVRHELAGGHDRARPACRAASRPAIAARNMSPVDDVRDAVLGGDALGLRPLAGPLRAEDEQVHERTQEALVGAHHHLRLHLAHRVERDADDDQHRGAAERAGGRLREAEVVDEDRRQDGDRRRGRASPGSVSRVSTRSRYCAVGGPGRMPGM